MNQAVQPTMSADYSAMEDGLITAFSTWHTFHEDLVKIGDFSGWLSDIDNHTDLATFFALDDGNSADYKLALKHQIEFLDGLKQMLEDVQDTVNTYAEQSKEKS